MDCYSFFFLLLKVLADNIYHNYASTRYQKEASKNGQPCS